MEIARIVKSDSVKRLHTGIVLAPSATQDANAIERIAHEFMIKGASQDVVESYLAPLTIILDNGALIPQGAWVVVTAPEYFNAIKANYGITPIKKDTNMATKQTRTVEQLREELAKKRQELSLAGVVIRKASEDSLWEIVNDYNATEAERSAANMQLVELYGSRDAVALEWRRRIGMDASVFPPNEFRENRPPAFNEYSFNLAGVGADGAPINLTPAQARAAGAGQVAKAAPLQGLWETVEDPNSTTLQKNMAWSQLQKFAEPAQLTEILIARARGR